MYKRQALLLPPQRGELHLQEFVDVPIGVLKVFPGIQFDLFESIMTEKLRGVVLEAFGAGNIPSGADSQLLPLVERAYRNGTIITVCSQCLQGSVSLGTYETSRGLARAEAVSGGDMPAPPTYYTRYAITYNGEVIRQDSKTARVYTVTREVLDGLLCDVSR